MLYHSDSLKSAIYAVGLSLFKEWKNEKLFFNSFRISSCFPYANDEYFLPKPQLKKRISFGKGNDDTLAKKVKKIEYLEKSVFEEYVNSNNNEIQLNQNNITPDGLFVCKNDLTFKKTDNKGNVYTFSFLKTKVQQRVKVPMEWENEDSEPFYIDRIYFEKNCGIYFLAEFENEKIREQVFKTIALLGENGIGTDRTVGNGQFNIADTQNEFSINITSNIGKYLSLGLYLPSLEEHSNIIFDESNWNLLKRGGYMAGSEFEEFMHLRKKSIYMFGEGSVLKSDKLLKGKFENLVPEWNNEKIHAVWRDGQCLLLKI